MLAEAIGTEIRLIREGLPALEPPEAPRGHNSRSAKPVATVLPHNIPIAGIRPLIWMALAGRHAMIKVSPVTAPVTRALAGELEPAGAVEPGQIRMFEPSPQASRTWFADAAVQCRDWIIYGRDTTIGEIHRHLAPGSRVLGFGGRLSGAIARCPAATADAAALAHDIVLFEGLGCLTPAAVALPGAGRADARDFAGTLAAAIGAQMKRWPVSTEKRAAHLGWRTRYLSHTQRQHLRFEAAQAGAEIIECLHGLGLALAPITLWPAVLENPELLAPQFLVWIVYGDSPAGMLGAVEQYFPPKLFGNTLGVLKLQAVELRIPDYFLRTVPWGAMQRPQFSWTHDGHDVRQFLLENNDNA